MNKDLNIFIQARMSSLRYPGKFLAPIKGIPLIKHLINRVRKLKNIKNIVVLTSDLESDEPLHAYLKSINCLCFRGDLENVFKRFQDALETYHSYYFMRLCADSPLVDTALMQFMVDQALLGKHSLISNVFSRKFPRGQSVEIIKSQIFLETNHKLLSCSEKEHVTPYFYKNIDSDACLFFELRKDLSAINQCVDTLEDMKLIDGTNDFKFNSKEIQKVLKDDSVGEIS